MHNVHTHERGREEFLIDSLKPLNLCRKALERLDGDEEEGQMWDAYVIGGDDFGYVAFSCLFPLISRDHSCIQSEILHFAIFYIIRF